MNPIQDRLISAMNRKPSGISTRSISFRIPARPEAVESSLEDLDILFDVGGRCLHGLRKLR